MKEGYRVDSCHLLAGNSSSLSLSLVFRSRSVERFRSLNELAWGFADGSNRPLQDRCRAGALNERNQGHFSSPTPHFVRAHHFFFRVVFTFNEDIRSHRFDQIQWSLFVKKHNGINIRESRNQPCASILDNNRATCHSESADRTIRVESNYKPVSLALCLLQQCQVSDMKQIKAPI